MIKLKNKQTTPDKRTLTQILFRVVGREVYELNEHIEEDSSFFSSLLLSK